ncbi:hypothetical protein REPUB_Repub17cG0165100 [Reevesia pubescens]
MWGIVLCLVALVLVWVYYIWQNPKCNGKLPPGSMGFPIIGESIEYFSPYSLLEISPFLKKRIARYGPIFRTCLGGQKVVMVTDPEFISSILKQEIMPPIQWYTQWNVKVTGEDQFVLSAAFHKYLRSFFMHQLSHESLMTPESVRQIDQATRTHLNCWATQGTIDARQAATKMIMEYVAKKISYDEPNAAEKLGENINTFVGYTIPAGWFLVADEAVFHFDPKTFDDPFSFNPWRWEGKKVHGGSKTFMPFGRGAGFCVGANFAKFQIAIFLHHLVTKYRWSVMKGNDILRVPILMFPKGFKVEISKKMKMARRA